MSKKEVVAVEPPSKKALAKATAVAVIVAAIVLVVAVLPAEYGIDPLGTGKALGLNDLAKATGAKATPEPAPATADKAAEPPSTIVPVLVPAPDGGAPTMKGTLIPQKAGFQVDSREIKLAPGEGMEIKYSMKKGAGLIYTWSASDKLEFEFHGEPNVKPAGKEGTDYYETYDIDNQGGQNERHGTFVAPSTGIHGWFWENKNKTPVTLTLVTSGFYDWIFQNRNDKQTALKPTDTASIPSHPKVPDELLR